MEKRVTKIRTSRKPRTRKASTDDVLADSEERQKVPAKWAEHYKRLIELRDRLTRERQTLETEAREEVPQFSMHMADAGSDSYDRDWAFGMISSQQDALCEVEQALDRIRTGSYGVCELTGKPIQRDRLTAIPWTRFSAKAEKELEREGKADTPQPRLGPRETVPRTQTDNQVGEEQEG